MKHLILVFFSIFLFSTNSFAANKTQLQKYNESPLSNVRNQVADQNAGSYTEIPNSNRKITNINTNVDTGKISGYIEDKTNYNGSLGKTYVATEIPYSTESAAKTWAKRFGKFARGGVATIVGSIVLDKFIDEVGWLIDEGGKVKKKNDDSNSCASSSDAACSSFSTLYYAPNALQNGYFATAKAAANASCASWGWGGVSSSDAAVYDGGGWSHQRFYCTQQDKLVDITGLPNSNYDSSSSPQYTEVTQQDFQDAVSDYLNNNPKTQLAADLLTNAYTLQDPNGNPTDDPKKADPDVNDAPREIHNATNDVLKSNDPLSIGKTSTFPIITYNNVTNNYNETTTNTDTTNNTTNTTTTEGQSQIDIPPACEYFATLCEWMDWTKKDDLPEKEEIDKEEPKIEEKQVPVNWGAQCPPAETITFTLEGQSIDLKIIDFEYICPQAPIISPLVIFSSTISALYIIFGFGNRLSGGSDD